MRNFSQSGHKPGYVYQLTPTGIAEKSVLTGRFLKRKMDVCELLRCEIEKLKAETPEESRSV